MAEEFLIMPMHIHDRDHKGFVGMGGDVVARFPECICTYRPIGDGEYAWDIRDGCLYHQLAATRPEDHSIPWNCPTYWDGCNCVTGEAVNG